MRAVERLISTMAMRVCNVCWSLEMSCARPLIFITACARSAMRFETPCMELSNWRSVSYEDCSLESVHPSRRRRIRKSTGAPSKRTHRDSWTTVFDCPPNGLTICQVRTSPYFGPISLYQLEANAKRQSIQAKYLMVLILSRRVGGPYPGRRLRRR